MSTHKPLPTGSLPFRLALAGLCTFALTLGGAGIARAAEEPEKRVFLGSLPLPQRAESVGARFPEYAIPYAVTVNQANGTVLVAAQTEPAIEHYVGEVFIYPKGGGAPLGSFNGSETPQGTLDFNSGDEGTGIAVDSTGDVYVSDPAYGHDYVDKFEPRGPNPSEGYKYVCQYSGPGRGCVKDAEESTFVGEYGPAGLAVDQTGDLYVADFGNSTVYEFNAAGETVAQIATSEAPRGLAVDTKGDLFVDSLKHRVEGNLAGDRAFELRLGKPGEVLGEVSVAPTSAGVVGIAFDVDSGSLLISERYGVVEYNLASATTVPVLSTGTGEEPYGGIATQETVGSPTGDIYVIEGENHTVNIYGEPPPLKPLVHGESAKSVTPRSASLGAVIEPQLRKTRYVFQFGSDQSYSGGELPAAPGGEVNGGGGDLVGVSLAGLTPGTIYHYRVVATNKEGTTYGPDNTFTTFAPEVAGLPDGRVWEMVSPLNKNGGSIGSIGPGDFQASTDGEEITFASKGAFGVAQGNSLANQYLAARGSGGWSTQNISPPMQSGGYLLTTPFKAFSSDLSRGLLRNGGSNAPLPIIDPSLPGSNAPAGYDNFYVRDNEDAAYQALLTSKPILTDDLYYMTVEGVTPDLRHIAVGVKNFDSSGRLVELNEWSAGGLAPVNIGVHGETVVGAVFGSGEVTGTSEAHVISDDGSRAFWSSGENASGRSVFVREGIGSPQPRTVALPPGEFVDASAQTGSKALLSTGEVFDVEHNNRLADLTEGAGGFMGELGASEDLSKIYFIDTAVLPGAGANSFGQAPQAGENNLYLYREGGSPSFIATLAAGTTENIEGQHRSLDVSDWSPIAYSMNRTVRVTADGGTIVFNSRASLTGYDNSDAVSGEPDSEVFVFHADTGVLTCVSCNPTGERPSGGAAIQGGETTDFFGGLGWQYYLPRILSSDGSRVFFETGEALIAQDTNNATDVYEWEEDGTGSCRKAGGCIALISSGTGAGSTFVDASESGENVFFMTADQLVPGDIDQLIDIYDARVDGGFPAPPTAPVCTGTGCQGIPAPPPIFATPSSVTFGGVGNVLAPPPVKSTTKQTVKCVKGKKLSRGKCVKRKKKAKKAKKSSRDRRTNS
jgi:hypothetical protein